MDWTTPLRSQQADFIQRLKSGNLGNLLHCETEGQHSELTVISDDRLKQLRKFCWQMAEKYKRTSQVYNVFINNLKGKLGEEVIKARLAGVVTEVDYEKRLSGDGKVDFRLNSDPQVGIQVKARYGNIDTIRWSISKEEIEKNTALICILIQEEVNEAQAEYNLIMAGFVPTKIIEVGNGKASVGIDELLYSGGLRSYLESLQFEDFIFNFKEIQQNSNHDILSESQQQKPTEQYNRELSWKVGERIIHENFGTGQVTHVFGSGKKIALAIKFPIGQKILDPQRTPMRRIESQSF